MAGLTLESASVSPLEVVSKAKPVSLAQDIHGKSYSNVMLAIELPDPQ